MLRKTFVITGLLSLACGTGGKHTIDLDGVLDSFVGTLDEIDRQVGPPAEEIEVTALPEGAADAEMERAFVDSFAMNLNLNPERTQYPTWLGVAMQPDGALKGYDDPNQNGVQDAGEKDVFLVELDLERERVIATDLQNSDVHRDIRVRRAGVGMATGFLLGRMLGNQGAAGVSTGKFAGMNMASKGYHASTGSKRVTSSSARSSGGSRSPSLGK